MAKRQGFIVGQTNPVTDTTLTNDQLNAAWDRLQVLRAAQLDGTLFAMSSISKTNAAEIANAILTITGNEPTGSSENELSEALMELKNQIVTSSLTFKGYVGSTAPSSSTYGLQVGNIWINSNAMPTSFPVAIAGVWDGTQWASTTDTYTVADFDFFRNTEDNEGYYWFGGEWVIMSTDMSTDYFELNQTTGKWELAPSINLPGSPTTNTPDTNDISRSIATTEWVYDKIASSVSPVDYIIEMQNPSAQNNYTWYRKYNSGWVEQGGYITSGGGTISVTLPVTMADANYQIILTGEHNSTTAGSTTSVSTNPYPVTTTGFYVNNYIENGSTRGDGDAFWWEVKGMGATSSDLIYTVPGTYTVNLEAGTYDFEISGAGGGAAAAVANLNANHGGGATGGSAAYGSFSLTLAQADTFTIVVGSRGAGATKKEGTATGASGGVTSITSTDLGTFVSLSGGTGGQAHATGNGDWMIVGSGGTVTTTLTTHSLNNGSAGWGTTAEGNPPYSGGPNTNPSPYASYGFGGSFMYNGVTKERSGSNGGNGFVHIIKQ